MAFFFNKAVVGVGFVAMVALFELVSIPMIEKKLLAAKPGYEAYRRSTFRLLPFSALKRFS